MMALENSLVRKLSKKNSFKRNSKNLEKLRSFKRILPTIPQPVSIVYSVTTQYSTQENYDENIVKYSTDFYDNDVADVITNKNSVPRILNIQSSNGSVRHCTEEHRTHERSEIITTESKRVTAEKQVNSTSNTTSPQRNHYSTLQRSTDVDGYTDQALSDDGHALNTLCFCCLKFNMFKAGKRSKHRLLKSVRHSLSRSHKGQFTMNESIKPVDILYLGNVTTILSKGEGSTEFAIKRVLQSSRQGKIGISMEMMINDKCLSLTCPQLVIRNLNLNADDFTECKYNLRRITNCSTSRSNPRVFAWTYRHETHHKRIQLSCHVVILKSKTAANLKTVELNEAIARAQAEHHRENKSKLRHRKTTLASRDTLVWNGNCFPQTTAFLDELEGPAENRELFTITERELS